MKVSKTLLQTIAVAVAVSTVASSCSIGPVIKPKKGEPTKKQEPYNCPGCGLG